MVFTCINRSIISWTFNEALGIVWQGAFSPQHPINIYKSKTSFVAMLLLQHPSRHCKTWVDKVGRQEGCLRLRTWIDLPFVGQLPKQRYCAKQRSEHPSVLWKMLLICRHPELMMTFSHQAATLVLKQYICRRISFSQAKCHLFLSFLTHDHYVSMRFPVPL